MEIMDLGWITALARVRRVMSDLGKGGRACFIPLTREVVCCTVRVYMRACR